MNHVLKLSAFVKPYWKQSLIALVFLTALVFLDLSIPRLVQRIIDKGIHQQNQQVVLQTGLLMIGISIVSAIIAVGNNIVSVKVGESVARDLREALFLKIQSFSYGDLDRMSTGRLMVRLTSDTGTFQRLTQVTLRIGTRAPLLMIGSLILMFHTSRRLAITILPLLFITSVIVVFFISKMEPLFRSVQQRLDRLNTTLQENVAGVRLIKAFVRADYECERFGAANEAFTRHSIRVMQFMATMSPALTFCVNLGMVIVIWAGGFKAIEGDITVGQVVAFTNYLMTTITPLTMMTLLSNVWASGIASAKRLDEVLDASIEVTDAPDSVALPATLEGEIVFEDVTFHYNGHSKEPVLQNVNLTIQPGQTVAILGATGAGKSTLVKLVPRFYDASTGRVLIDGLDVRGITQDSLLSHIAMVPQDTTLFSGSIIDNIRYGAPEIPEDQVIAAAKTAQAHEFIMALPDGYGTHVEERGVNLSGGQKQRIAIARALITRPGILILDDSTSSVDVETETKIQEALIAQPHQPTTIVVAQRISTVLKADKIIVIDKGKLVAEGSHQDLIRLSPIYQEIYESQLGGGNTSRNNSGSHQENPT